MSTLCIEKSSEPNNKSNILPASTADTAKIQVHSSVPNLEAAEVKSRVEIRARKGVVLAGWEVHIGAKKEADKVHLRLVLKGTEDNSEIEKELPLQGQSREERLRELATAIVVLIDDFNAEKLARENEQARKAKIEQGERPPPANKQTNRLHSFARLGTQYTDGGAGAYGVGGIELFDAHVNPLLRIGWVGFFPSEPQVNQVAFGGGLELGSPLPDQRLWLGTTLSAQAAYLIARDAEQASTFIGVYQMSLTTRYQQKKFQIGANLGLLLRNPSLRIRGQSEELSLSATTFFISLEFGIRI